MTAPEPRITAAIAELGRWSDALPEYDVNAGAVRHAELLRSGAPAPLLREASLLSRTVWWIAGGVAVVALGIAVTARSGQDEEVAIADATVPSSTVTTPTRALAVPARAPTIATAATSVTIEAQVEPPTKRVATTARASKPVASSAPTADTLDRELALVRRMRAATPSEVLELARTADREIGRGVLGEERDALEVLALAERGDARATTKALAFLRARPDSPFAAKLESIAAN